MTLKERLSHNLDVQAQHEGETENITFLRRVLGLVEYSSEWEAITYRKHHRYGPLSYETHVFCYAKPFILALCKPEEKPLAPRPTRGER